MSWLGDAVRWSLVGAGLAALTTLNTGLAAEDNAEIRLNLPYGSAAEAVDLCIPAQKTTRPAVVLFHGGGWIGGNRQTLLGFCKDFARNGFLAATYDYRLAGTPEGAWPAQLQDAQLAVRWLRAKARELAIGDGRVCAFGTSAGGHLAALLATRRATVSGDRADRLPDVSSVVQCAVDDFGPTDLTGKLTPGLTRSLRALADSDDEKRIAAVARDASPLLKVGAATAPMMIVQGDYDAEVPPAQARVFRDALAAAHVPVTFLSYPGGHSFKGLSPEQQQAVLRLEMAFVASAH